MPLLLAPVIHDGKAVFLQGCLYLVLPPFDDASNANKMGQKKRVKEDLLKSFGYKRPTSK